MAATTQVRLTPVLKRAPVEEQRAVSTSSASQSAARALKVLQSSRAPAQLCLFLRPSAVSAK
jgi:hypothetical protein